MPIKQFLFGFAGNPRSLVFFRVITAVLTSLSLIAIWPDFQQFYGPDAFVDPKLLEASYSLSTLSIQQGVIYLQAQTRWTAEMIQAGIGLSYFSLCLLLLLGLFTRVSALLLLILHGSLFTAVPQFSYGIDYFCSMALFYCALFPCGYYSSIDRLIFRLSPSPWLGPCQRLLQVHLCIIYFFSGFDKALGHTWRNGEALWKALHLPYFQSDFTPTIEKLAPYPWLFLLLGWGVLLSETLYPFLIWLKPTRKLQLALIISLHIGIALLLRLYLFSAMMIAWNIAAFYFLPAQQKYSHSSLHTKSPVPQKYRLAERLPSAGSMLIPFHPISPPAESSICQAMIKNSS